MPKYRYEAFDISGVQIENSIVAVNKKEALSELDKKGYLVSKISATFAFSNNRKKVSNKAFFQFNKELIVLVRAGIPLTDSLKLLIGEFSSGGLLSSFLERIYEHLIDGESFSIACARYDEVFDPVYIATISMGEHTGKLSSALENYQSYLARKIKVEATIKQALSYPLFLFGTLAVVFVILFVVVVPKFSALYDSFGAELPVPTQIVLMLSGAIPVILAVSVAILTITIYFWRRWDKPNRAYIILDKIVSGMPIVGKLRQFSQKARCMRMLSGLLLAGTTLLSSLRVAGAAFSKIQLGHSLLSVAEEVESGQSFSQALKKANILSQSSAKMIQVGESTGALAEMLNEIADYYENELDELLARFSTLFEPILMVVIGVLIGAVILAMYMPIFFLAEVVQ